MTAADIIVTIVLVVLFVALTAWAFFSYRRIAHQHYREMADIYWDSAEFYQRLAQEYPHRRSELLTQVEIDRLEAREWEEKLPVSKRLHR